MKPEFSPYFYPTTVALIDDNSAFLNTLAQYISPYINCKCFNDPSEALEFINHSSSSRQPYSDLLNRSIRWRDGVHKYLSEKQYDMEKATELSVVVVDYDMPEMDGLQLCEKINNPAVQKILLTGYASSENIINAFNQRLINYYLSKQTDNLLEEIKSLIEKMQLTYFNDNFQTLTTSYIERETPFFMDSALADFFRKLCLDLNIEEYYFNPNNGRFMLKAQDKNIALLIVDDMDIEEHIAIIKDEDGPEEWIELLRSKKLVPFFTSSDGYYTPETQVDNYPFLNATLIKGKCDYYCAIVDSDLPIAEFINSGNNSVH